MYKGKRICVVVPCYNEENTVSEVIRTMPSIVDHIVVVDDASSDKTSDVALSCGDSRVEVRRHERNMGVGGAIVTGHKRAIQLGADVSVVMAGDGQMSPEYLPTLLDPVVAGECSFAKGNRFLGKHMLREMPRARVFGNAVLSLLTKFASGYYHIFDPQNGYTAASTLALMKLDLDDLAKGYVFENDMLVELNIIGARVIDVAIPAVYRGRSKLNAFTFAPRILMFLARKFFRRLCQKYILRDFQPFALLFIAGSLLFLMGVAVGIEIIYSRYLSPQAISPSTGTVMLSVLPLFLGIQLVLFAMLMDMMNEPK
jgi:glycosyltransferase involved in cell wall biosynthesis